MTELRVDGRICRRRGRRSCAARLSTSICGGNIGSRGRAHGGRCVLYRQCGSALGDQARGPDRRHASGDEQTSGKADGVANRLKRCRLALVRDEGLLHVLAGLLEVAKDLLLEALGMLRKAGLRAFETVQEPAARRPRRLLWRRRLRRLGFGCGHSIGGSRLGIEGGGGDLGELGGGCQLRGRRWKLRCLRRGRRQLLSAASSEADGGSWRHSRARRRRNMCGDQAEHTRCLGVRQRIAQGGLDQGAKVALVVAVLERQRACRHAEEHAYGLEEVLEHVLRAILEPAPADVARKVDLQRQGRRHAETNGRGRMGTCY
mmetsp:Transcript_52637/g.171119  ORF Transcript_52637/g.171119 Transcript_52637/m.171119 type:complete len:317 (+) Transcript_52637:682-1632(+)